MRLVHLDEADEPVIRNMNNLAMALYRQEKYDEAESLSAFDRSEPARGPA